MVIQVNNETKQIGEAEVEMMDRFAQAFPSTNSTIPKNNLITVVNFM